MEKKSRNDIEETSDEYEVLPDYFVGRLHKGDEAYEEIFEGD